MCFFILGSIHFFLKMAGGVGHGSKIRLGTARPLGAMVPGGRVGLPSSLGRPMTNVVEGDGGPRPMTAIKGAGFSSTGNTSKQTWLCLY